MDLHPEQDAPGPGANPAGSISPLSQVRQTAVLRAFKITPQTPTESASDAGSIQSDWTDAEVFPPAETLQEQIVRVTADEGDLKTFFTISFSPDRAAALAKFYRSELLDLESHGACQFDGYSQDERTDYILLKKYLARELRRLDLKRAKDKTVAALLPFTSDLIRLCQARQHVQTQDLKPRTVADAFTSAAHKAASIQADIEKGKFQADIEKGKLPKCDTMTAFRAVRAVRELQSHVDELCQFFHGYDPSG